MAGQVQHYMREQMRDFASAVRNNAIMSPFAQALSADDTADVIAYYAGASAPLPPLVPPNPALMQRGEKLAQNGDPSRNIPACEDCHGPRGAGQAPVIPYLAGQYAQYITAELHAWQDGSRNNSPAVMAAFAKKLTGDDIDALAAYYQALAATAPVAAAK
jgi:cytochrome c553